MTQEGVHSVHSNGKTRWGRWISRNRPGQPVGWLTTVVVFGVIFGLLTVAYLYSTATTMIQYQEVRLAVAQVVYPGIVLNFLGFVGALLLLKFRKWGWLLVTGFFVSSILSAIPVLIKGADNLKVEMNGLHRVTYAPLDIVIWETLIGLAVMVFLGLKPIRSLFSIGRQQWLYGLGFGVLLFLARWVYMILFVPE